MVAPLIVLSTLVLFATGTALLALGETEGTVVGLHKASFIVWVGATGVHVLAHLRRLPGLLRLKAPGRGIRLALVTGTVVTGLAIATVAFPTADHLQDRVGTRRPRRPGEAVGQSRTPAERRRTTGMEKEMRVLSIEGTAIHGGPEPWSAYAYSWIHNYDVAGEAKVRRVGTLTAMRRSRGLPQLAPRRASVVRSAICATT